MEKMLKQIINESIDKRLPYSTCPADWTDDVIKGWAYVAGTIIGTAKYVDLKRTYRDMQSPVKYK